MMVRKLPGIIFLLSLASCSGEPKCASQGFTRCSYGTDTYSAELFIIFPEIERKSDGKACEVDYPRPFPLATKLGCKQLTVGKDTSSIITSQYEDVDGNRIYSCVDVDGNVFVSYVAR
jgi:hypothetical protein